MARAVKGMFVVGIGVIALFLAATQHQAKSEHEVSDEFWGGTYLRALEAEQYESHGDLARASDIVVVGRVASVSVGRTLRAADGEGDEAFAWYANVEIEVEETLKGELPEALSLEVFFTRADRRDAFVRSPTPGESALFFVRNKEVAALAAGWSVDQARAERDYYMLVNMSQGYLRDLDGEAHTPFTAEGDMPVLGDFSDVVTSVREAIADD